ncbi:unnamed protein product [Chilo suppressalis]|uniref:Metalloendopeptidase n=1 Tax=Chilo suppressalis TaxID=168631 RepID=A0ABN8B5L1_CHISP|nr:unnamed protein product [Chilo suppressalis]
MVWKCIRIFIFFFILCAVPIKRSLTSAESIHKLTFFGLADRWAINVLKERVSVSGLEEAEPGFDLTDAEIKKFKLWPNGVIPYFIDDFSYDKVLRDRIRHFLEMVGGVTGLHFRELPGPPEDTSARWVFFVNRQAQLGCSDHTPLKYTNEGVQKVVLGYNCMNEEGELSEAVLAIVGVSPQHNAPDRDAYIQVEMQNILPDKQYLFKKLQNRDWLFHDLEYDFNSAGHFNFHKHTKNGLASITPKKPNEIPVGENEGFSYTDVLKIRMLYNYISRKKSKTIKVPECKKLFKPGRNFSQFQSYPEEKVKPRPKPKKYTGSDYLKDESGNVEEGENVVGVEEKNNKDIGEENEEQIKGEAEKNVDEENNKNVEKESKEDLKEENKMTSRDNSERGVEGDNKALSHNIPNFKALKGFDPLYELSDYNDEDRKRRRGRKIKLTKNMK